MSWTEAVSLNEIETDDVIRWDHNGATYALYRTDDDEVYASDGFCTHESVHLADGLLMGHLIECPKHNGRFDIRDGSPKRAPVCVALRTYPAKVVSGMIWVELPN